MYLQALKKCFIRHFNNHLSNQKWLCCPSFEMYRSTGHAPPFSIRTFILGTGVMELWQPGIMGTFVRNIMIENNIKSWFKDQDEFKTCILVTLNVLLTIRIILKNPASKSVKWSWFCSTMQFTQYIHGIHSKHVSVWTVSCYGNHEHLCCTSKNFL